MSTLDPVHRGADAAAGSWLTTLDRNEKRTLAASFSGYAVDGPTTLVVDLGDVPRSEAVGALVRAGVGVDRVAPRRRLEDAFLALVGDSTAGSGDR